MANIHFKHSAMNAGKTTQLIQAAFNYTERGMHPIILKPKIDTRSGAASVNARIGLEHKCIDFLPNECVSAIVREANALREVDVVLIDEAQFMSEAQVMDLITVAKLYNIPVVCYGLKTDFSGNLFVGSAKLLAIADKFEALKTICWCGDGATQNARIDANGDMVTVGNSIEVGDVGGRYVPLCMKHYAYHQPTQNHTSAFAKYRDMIADVRKRDEISGGSNEPSSDTIPQVDMARSAVAK